ncbi:MAG TPA: DUF3592 domain-containing protein [Byssovorax sp.]|jgi:hypothetical protein
MTLSLACARTLFLLDFLRPHGSSPSTDPFSYFSFTWLIGPIMGLGITVAVVVLVVLPILKGSAERQRLLQSGEHAQGRILSTQETGTRINGHPLVNIALEVHPQNGQPPFQAVCSMTVSMMTAPRLQPGMTVGVRYDPQKQGAVAIDV